MEMNGDERRWRWRTEREIIFGSFVGRERESRDSERERAGQEATKERREESFFIIRIMKGTATVFSNALGNIVVIPMFPQI
jgi:hypothetical protein